jgi:hypothetical protein
MMRGTRRKVTTRWRRFKHSAPGHRFQERYYRARKQRESGQAPGWARPFNLFGGLVLVVAGFAFLPTPGPSYIIIVLGLWMMAGQWLPLARFFDWAEPRLRKLWKLTPLWVKVLVGLALVGGLAYLILGLR